jgi:hypothetical protein
LRSETKAGKHQSYGELGRCVKNCECLSGMVSVCVTPETATLKDVGGKMRKNGTGKQSTGFNGPV